MVGKIKSAMDNGKVPVIVAPLGYGKSTQLMLQLTASYQGHKNVDVVVPNRVLA